jgi:hypothetical protein
MKRALAVLIGAAALVAVAAGAGAAPHGTQADLLRAAEQAREQALVAGDTEAAGRLMAPDWHGINPAGQVSTREQALAQVDNGVLDYRVFEPASPIDVDLHGGQALLRFKVNFDVVLGGQVHAVHQAWITEVWELRDGRWMNAFDQTTAIPNNFGLFAQSLAPTGS